MSTGQIIGGIVALVAVVVVVAVVIGIPLMSYSANNKHRTVRVLSAIGICK